MKPDKYVLYSNLFEETVGRIKEEWPAFLNTAAKMYKYPFEDQLMIHAQRPDAKACATMEIWNKAMNRWVNRGAKGIVLLDSREPTGVRHIFDISDTTEGRYGFKRNVQLWNLNQGEHEETVIKTLSNAYNESGDDLSDIIDNISRKLTAEYFSNNEFDIKDNIPSITGWEFRIMMEESIGYIIRSRCGLYAEFPGDLPVADLPTESVHVLGITAGNLSEQVLRGIELAVKQYEREKERQNEQLNIEGKTSRIDLQPGGKRELSDSEHIVSETVKVEQVRTPARGISEEPPPGIIRPAVGQGGTEPALRDDRRDGGPADRADGGTYGGERPAAEQSDRPDRVGSAHEHVTRNGTGRRNAGTHPQLSLFDNIQPSREQDLTPDAAPLNTEVFKEKRYDLDYRQALNGWFVVNKAELNDDGDPLIVALVSSSRSVILFEYDLPEDIEDKSLK